MSIVALVLLATIVAGVVLPVGHLVDASLRLSPGGALTLQNFADVLGSGYFLGALGATLAFCAATAALATVLALPGAWWMARRRAGARVLRMLCQVNFAFSGVVYGMLVVTLLGNAGVIALAEAMLFGTEFSRGYAYTTAGLAVGYLGFQAPRAATLLAQAVERLDPQVLAAARVLGAGPLQRAAWVVLPQLARPMLTTFLALAMMSVASFGTALLIARTIEIYPLLIYREFTGFGEVHRAAAMGVVLALCCVALEFAARTAARGRPRAERDPTSNGA